MVAMFQVVDKFSHAFFKSAFKFETVKTDTKVFRLYYKLSVWLVLLYSICYMHVAWNKPISCMSSNFDKKYSIGKFTKEVNDYCWVHGTYVLPDLHPDDQISSGVGPMTGKSNTVHYHHYYKWMYFYITITIILLHTPRQFWRLIESGRLKSLVKKLRCLVLGKDDDTEREKECLAEYLHCHMGYHGRYAFGFVFGEFLNVVVSAILMLLWDFITDHELSVNGTSNFAFIRTPRNLRTDRMAMIFPILGKCTFNNYGPGGNIQAYDFLCLLPLNVINEGAAIFFWYYFMLLVAIGSTALICRAMLMASKNLRAILLSGLTPLTSKEDIAVLTERCSYSDWFVIYQLGSCMDPILFREVMKKLVMKFQAKLL